jgi:hypothetical protein
MSVFTFKTLGESLSMTTPKAVRLFALSSIVSGSLLFASCVNANSQQSGKDKQCPPTAATQDKRSLAEAAKSELIKRHQQILRQLARTNAATMPHEVKILRKDIGDMKMVLDIFFDVYPESPSDMAKMGSISLSSLASNIRDDLDKGYEIYGNFKDLFDSQGIDASYNPETQTWSTGSAPAELKYDLSEVATLRIELLQWTNLFTNAVQVKRYSQTLESPLVGSLADRPKKDQARLYWGSVNIEPNVHLTASQNLRNLVGSLALAAEKNFEKVLDIKNPIKDDDTYHDLRKRLRAMAKIMTIFPDVVAHEDVAKIQSDFVAISDDMGDLFDKIVALEKKKHHSEKDMEKILGKWKDMKDDFKKNALQKRLQKLTFLMECGRKN